MSLDYLDLEENQKIWMCMGGVSTNSSDFAGSEVIIGEGTTSKETDTGQDYIVMPLWKNSSLFDSPSMNVSHDEPEPSCDAKKKDGEEVSKASEVDDQERPESITLNINTVGPSINTASANPRTGSLHINTVSPTVITSRSNRPQSVSDIFSLRDNVTPEATNANLFGDESKWGYEHLNASYQVYKVGEAHGIGCLKLQEPSMEDPCPSTYGQWVFLDEDRSDLIYQEAKGGFQVTPKVSHSHAVKRIFRYLKRKPKLGLWYPRDSPFDLVAYSDSDYCKKQTVVATSSTKAEYVAAASCCGQVLWIQNQMLDYGQAWMEGHVSSNKVCYKESKISRHVKRGRDTKIPQSSGSPVKVGDEAVHKELGDKMERAATTASSLEVEQDSGNINRTQSMATLNDPRPYGTGSGSGPRCQVTILGLQMLKLVTARTTDDGEVEITATIDGQVKTITEASLRRHLKLEDSDGITSLPNTRFLSNFSFGVLLTSKSVLTAEDIMVTETVVVIRRSASKDKGKGIMTESEPEQTLQKLPTKRQKELGFKSAIRVKNSLMKKKGKAKVNQDHDIDWSDPAVLRYHTIQNRSFSKAKDSEIEKEVMKRPRFDLQQESTQKNEKIESKTIGNLIANEMWDTMRYIGQISFKTYTFFCEMLNDFDREDLILLYRLLNEKYASTRPGFLMTNDLGRSNRIMLIPDSDDEVWKNHQSQELIKWKLYDSCGVHPLMLGEVSIHMLVEKKYPLPQDTLTRMLQWKLHVNNDVTEYCI
ncbi:hypothetical protein Tco_0083794 [Tanacetum coccineum]